jgi:hypothetical protein
VHKGKTKELRRIEEMDYQNLVRDFIQRTRKNLEYIEKAHATDPSAEVYEVTQLINSLLGLIVFPKEQYFLHIPETPLEDLAAKGWKIPDVKGNFSKIKNLRQLMQYMRNAVAHSNLEFISDGHKLTGIRLWNCTRGGVKNWQIEMKLTELREITYKFIDLILADQNLRHFEKRAECQKGQY